MAKGIKYTKRPKTVENARGTFRDDWNKNDAARFAANVKAGRADPNAARPAGPVRHYTPEEIAAFQRKLEEQ